MSMIGPAHPGYQSRRIIGLSGYARAGKDTVADIVEEYGFKRFAFADKLRECLFILNPIVVANANFHGMLPPEGEYDGPVYRRLQYVIDRWGWNGYKESPFSDDIRRLLQVMGTEVGREQIMDDIWVRELDKHFEDTVITDLRFPNEYDKIIREGGEVWRINRPGVDAVNAHKSEKAIDDKKFDVIIDNDGTIADLAAKVAAQLSK